MYILGALLVRIYGSITAYLLKLTDCQLPVDAEKIKVHDVF